MTIFDFRKLIYTIETKINLYKMKKDNLDLILERLKNLIHDELKLFLSSKNEFQRAIHKKNIISYLDMVKNYE